MIILIPKINFINFPLYLILSYFVRIKAYEIQVHWTMFKGRIELLDLSDYFDWENCEIIKSDAVKIWEDILPEFSISKWQLKIRNCNLDLSLKAKQDLQKEIEKLSFLKNILQFYKDKEKVYIINSLKIKFLSKIDRDNNLFHYPTIRSLSAVNVLFDRFIFMLSNLCLFARTICLFVYGIIYNKKIKGRIKYIYDGVSSRELSIDKDKITFSWLVDGNLIQKKDILFLLPKADFQMKAYAFDYTKDKDLLVSNHFNMLRFSSREKIFSCFSELMKIFINTLWPNFKLEYLMLIGYSICISKWLPIIESLRSKIFICSSSNICCEDPAITYFNLVGIKTIIWTYGTNGYLFLAHNRNCNFRNVTFCNFISSTLVVWNQHFKEFIEEHPQDGLELKVIGPLMCGDENILDFNKQVLFEYLRLSFNSKSMYIAIFDSPRVSEKYRGNYAWRPEFNSEEYNYLFIKDMYRLLSDFENIILVYKPKRSLTSGKFSYSVELKKLFKNMEENSRVIILDHNINPWIPIAIADMCISMPFESPTIIALHYEKTGLFHDPMNIVLYHKYQAISELLSHSYEDLKTKVKYRLFENNSISTLPQIKDFQGLSPKENSSDKFREYLASL